MRPTRASTPSSPPASSRPSTRSSTTPTPAFTATAARPRSVARSTRAWSSRRTKRACSATWWRRWRRPTATLTPASLGAKYLLNALLENGRADVAYRIASQKDLPSWGWWIEQGATTLWEQWNGADSRNHIMFGDISAWFYKALAGINLDPAAPGLQAHPHQAQPRRRPDLRQGQLRFRARAHRERLEDPGRALQP